jgi:hypothetical protein
VFLVVVAEEEEEEEARFAAAMKCLIQKFAACQALQAY